MIIILINCDINLNSAKLLLDIGTKFDNCLQQLDLSQNLLPGEFMQLIEAYNQNNKPKTTSLSTVDAEVPVISPVKPVRKPVKMQNLDIIPEKPV